MAYIWFILIGVITGWVAGVLVKDGDFGIFGDIFFGICGALTGGFLFRSIEVYTGGHLLVAIFASSIGAGLLVLIRRLFKRNHDVPSKW